MLVLGDDVRGSKRWIEFGTFNFQPSELGKVLFVLFLAGFLADRARRIGEWKTTLAAIGLSLPPILLVFKEPDFGTALIYAAAVGAILLLACVPWSHLAALAATVGIVLTGVVWLLPAAGIDVLQPYQVDRLIGFLDPDVDPSGTTYNVNQSITAVGSGGLDGRGVSGATQMNVNYLPEHKTDFVFSALAEQRGFLGASVLLLLYALHRLAWDQGHRTCTHPLLRDGRRRNRRDVPLPGVRERRHDDRDRADHGHSAPVRQLRGSSLITMMFMVGLLEAIHVRGRLAGRP